MPRYFFDTDDGDSPITDDSGLDLPDRETARLYALGGLRDMARDHLPDGDRRDFSVNVRGENSVMVYTVSMSLVGRWLS